MAEHSAENDAPSLAGLVRQLADEWAAEGDEVSHWFASQVLYDLLDRARTADAERLAQAWDEGHETRWRRGPDGCGCGAWSIGDCACGEYGTGELLSLKQNPYRVTPPGLHDWTCPACFDGLPCADKPTTSPGLTTDKRTDEETL